MIYGNVGVPERLQFTVVGAAVNEVVRVQDLTKQLGCPLLATATFAERHGRTLATARRASVAWFRDADVDRDDADGRLKPFAWLNAISTRSAVRPSHIGQILISLLRFGRPGKVIELEAEAHCRTGLAAKVPYLVVAKVESSVQRGIRRKHSDGREDKYIFVRHVEATEGIVIMGPSEHN